MAVHPHPAVTNAKATFSATGRRAVDRLATLMGQLRPDQKHAERKGFLEPILVRLSWGRVGSTFLMQLLATSAEISFDRIYPFENMCLASLLHYLEPLGRAKETPNVEWIDDPDTIWWAAPESFGFRITGAPLGYEGLGVDRMALNLEAITSLWQAYSDLAPWPGDSRPRFYAEKYGGGAESLAAAGISHRMIDMVRDPRDIWCSVLAFDAKRGYYGFGRREGQSEEEYLSSFLRALKRRLDAMAGTSPDVSVTVVRYEDLMADLGQEAQRISTRLGVQLDPCAALRASEEYGHHRTIDRADESIDRWRQQVSPEVNARFVEVLGDHLDRYSYPRH
jgi:hypothetical protein